MTGLEAHLADNESEDKGIRIHYQQDVEPLLNHTKMLRNNGLTDHGIKNDLWHYATIPPVVIMKLKIEYGLDVFNRGHLKRVFEVINRDFPDLKTTEKVHTLNH